METVDPRPSGPDRLPVVGVDLGSSSVRVVVLGDRGSPTFSRWLPGRGRSLQVLTTILDDELRPVVGDGPLRLGVTGYAQGLVARRVSAALANEVVAVAAAAREVCPEARTVLDLGGQFTKWILLGDDGAESLVAECALNGLCAAGSGAFLEQQAGRLKMSVEELGRVASSADRGATIAGRCSVFAKSDMIHLQQRGTPTDEIAYGLCLALARTFVATVLQGRSVEGPVVFAGGGSANPGLTRAFQEVLKLDPGEVTVPENHAFLGAVGAALMAREAAETRLEEVLSGLRSRDDAEPPKGQTANGALTALPDPSEAKQLVDKAVEDPGPEALPPAGPVEAILGVDVGSVSTNLTVVTPELEVLMGIYLPTRGRPVDVLAEGLALIRERFGDRLSVLAAGATGSGRYLAERIMGMDVVHNEITAQMISASRFVPEVDTVFEIGGQDSKYIGARQGHLAAFEMNKICAAGTGSFLEEQAERLDVNIIGEFARLALDADQPADLGSKCTVFMDTELVRSLQRGVPVPDLCAGLAYSIARNYLDKVVAGRPVGRTVVFSGGTASNDAVVAAFNRILGRPVHVHPYNRIAGAIGAASLAIRHHQRSPGPSMFRGLSAIREHKIKTFECKRCTNRCQVSRVIVGERAAHFGDTCERYTEKDRQQPDERRPARPFPELFTRRSRLMTDHMPAPHPAKDGQPAPRMGLALTSLNLELAPLWATFLDELGFEPVSSGKTTARMLEIGATGLPAEVCLPLKLAGGHVRQLAERGIERVFMPAVMEFPRAVGDDLTHSCLFAQSVSDMLRLDSSLPVLAPQVCLSDEDGIKEAVSELSEALELPTDRVARALRQAMQVQQSFRKLRITAGKQALDSDFSRAVVIIGKPYNCYDPYVNLDLARHLDRLGLPAIPFDMLPLDQIDLDERWRVLPWYFNRDHIRAIELAAKDERLFPLVATNFGCGPDAFTLKHIEEMVSHKPRLVLEFDEHRGEAGMITRLEAFADEIEAHLNRTEPTAAPRPAAPRAVPTLNFKRCFVPYFSEHAHVFAALLEGAGVKTVVLDPPDEETVRLAEEVGSGKECHPYSLMAADLVKLARSDRPKNGDVFYSPNTITPCLLPQYGDGYRYLLRQLGLAALPVWDPCISELIPHVGLPALLSLYEGLLALDMLIIASCRFRPYEDRRGAIDRAHKQNIHHIARTVAERGDVAAAFTECVQRLRSVPLTPAPRRPVVGVAGDLYTRINDTANANLFERLERMGCEIWPNPYFAGFEDYTSIRNAVRSLKRVQVGDTLWGLLTASATSSRARRLKDALGADLRRVCVEPDYARLTELAMPYLGKWTNHLVLCNVGKMVDFVRRGAAGVINAIGLNCMAGITSAAAIPAIRADHDNVPIITLTYGGTEGPAQKIQLETFVHQVGGRLDNGGPV
jgi:predicted CoA-substrate-specific enzyme activase